MARQVLENGVVLPAEYSDDWYDDMTSNLTKLDDVIGSDSEKLSSADVGAAALSNNYNDLDNLPTIPTVNDATLTIQKNGVDVQTFTANASSNVTCNITVPTKTSDITNDSNFVDTSNSAVSSGITSAKVTDYDTHIADTDIHVTTADKTKWNNGVSQAYVFRYSSTALVASSTNSNTLLDNTDNLKVGDKVIDSSGVLFSITAIDTANNTFTIGTALIDLAQDSDVVHKSGNETISGTKTLDNVNLPFKNSAELGVSGGSTNITFSDKNGQQLCALKAITYSSGTPSFHLTVTQKVDNTIYTTNGISVYQQANSKVIQFRPILSNDNADGLKVELGSSANRYNRIYGLAYYYGNDNVEFSTKFVTTDTNQTIDGVKTYSSDLFVANTDTTANTPNLNLRNYKVDRGTTDTGVQTINFLDKNAKALTVIESRRTSNGSTGTNILTYNTDDSNNTVSGGVAIIKSKTSTNFAPSTDNAVTCGRALAKWSDVVTYKVNGLEPSSLSLPSDRSARVDISSYITNLGNGDNNQYIVPANGYIWLHFTSINSALCYSQTSGGLTNYAQTFVRYQGDGQLYAFFPVRKNDYFIVQIYTASTAVVQNAYFIPCQGNV